MSSVFASFKERADFYEMEHAAKLGGLLPGDSAKALEKILLLNPNDLVNRARLLGHYWKQYKAADGLDSDGCAKRTNHILWFIENAPDCTFAGDFYLSCDPARGEDSCRKVRLAWEKVLKERPTCAQSKVNYALFLSGYEQELAIKLMLELVRVEPSNRWALALLPILGSVTERTLPLHENIIEPPLRDALQDRLRSTKKMLSGCSIPPRISRRTVETQERILEKDAFDIWARLDILRWCQENMERANRIGFDPEVAQQWYRHALWTVRNLPQVELYINNFVDFGFGMKLPPAFFDPIKEAFIKAFRESPNKEIVFRNALGLFKANMGVDEIKDLLFQLQDWKNLDRKVRQKLLKELNWKNKRQKIFEIEIDLNCCSKYLNAEISAPSTSPDYLSAWVSDLNLTNAKYEGYNYSSECARNLESSLDERDLDLISAARLVGYYSRSRKSLEPEQRFRLANIIMWLIESAPECNFVAETRFYDDDQSSDVAPLKAAWQKKIKESPQNSSIAVNAASWLSFCDRDTALLLTEGVLEYQPDHIFAKALKHWLSHNLRDLTQQFGFCDLDFEATCKMRIQNFRPIANEKLTEICDTINLYIYSLLECLSIPQTAVWSNEQALKLNPNDAILRTELLGWYDRNMHHRTLLMSSDPELARIKTDHILWLLENVPQSDLYFLCRFHELEGIPSHGKILARAIRFQRKVYGKSIAKYRAEFPRKGSSIQDQEE